MIFFLPNTTSDQARTIHPFSPLMPLLLDVGWFVFPNCNGSRPESWRYRPSTKARVFSFDGHVVSERPCVVSSCPDREAGSLQDIRCSCVCSVVSALNHSINCTHSYVQWTKLSSGLVQLGQFVTGKREEKKTKLWSAWYSKVYG